MSTRARRTVSVAFIASFALGVAAAAGALGCGYRALYAEPGEARYAVVLASARVADAVANDEVVAGLRATLAREGALAAGTGYPRVEVEVLRADEVSEGIASAESPGGHVPRARATQVGILARAWIVRVKGGAHEADTGDVRAFNVVQSAPAQGEGALDPAGGARASGLVSEGIRHDDALRAVARRVGQRLALRVLGHPVARDESAEELW
ncbi:hypothetical protein [Pendulispora albinea]|uniref:Uncharacterized protein n=1 Tax=Pendulispora albinea TaxID=2741071 RepID=A0ABZ2LJD7_9BACT